MKLRIQDDSIRFRLSRTEIQQLGKSGYIENTTHFYNSKLVYAIDRIGGIPAITVEFSDNFLLLHIPNEQAMELVNTDKVGIESSIDIEDGTHFLNITVEKDFKCVGKENEADQSDNFENPRSIC